MVKTAKRIALTRVFHVYQKQTARNAKNGFMAVIATIHVQMKIVTTLVVLGFMVKTAKVDAKLTAIFVHH
jgi:hypothetical protein